MASLAMIESPSSTAIIEPKEAPPAYSDEPDATLEKEPLIFQEADADVEVTVINHKPITSKITTTIGHLQRVGGFRARWRGLGFSVLYHFLHAVCANLMGAAFGPNVAAQVLIYVFTSVGLARVHMLWTHSMIAYPSTKPFYRRMVPRKQCKAILLPALVYALAELATVALPVGVALALNVPAMHKPDFTHGVHHKDCAMMALSALRFLAVPATALIVAISVLLPAAVTLTRIEATLLPEDEQTIVPFDREAIVGNIDLSVRGSSRALFVEAWRSFDRSARLRLIKLYAKMVLAQITIVFVGAHLMVAELYIVGPEKLTIFFKSGVAQLKLMAIEAHQAPN